MAASRPPPRSRRVPGFAALVVLPLAGIALLVAGLLGVVSFAAQPLFDALRVRDWVPVSATVEAVSVRPPFSAIHPPLDVLEIRYRYSYGDGAYVGTRYDAHGGMFPIGTAAEVAAALQAAPTTTVWLDPRAPDRAVVRNELRGAVLLFAFPAALMLAAGAFMVYRGMLAWSRVRR